MTRPSRASNATSDSTTSLPTSADRKRKRPSPQATVRDSDKQPTLQSLFSGQQKPQVHLRPTTPDKKRQKASPAAPVATPPSGLASRDMYTFSSRSPTTNGSNVIDLVNGSSPISSRINGSTKPLSGRLGLNSHTGAKKLVVKNLKTNTSWDSKAYLEKIWDQVDEALATIFKDGHDGFSKEDLYRGVENVCRQGGASTMYSRLENRCRTHVEHDMRDRLLGKTNLDNVAVLRAVLAEWSRWTEQMLTVRAIFFFMDRSYLLPSSKPTLDQFSPQIFRQIVFDNETLRPKIVDGACDLVAAERTQTKALDKALFRQAVEMFQHTSTYTASFEPRFLALTQEYVADWSDDMIVDKSVSEYVAKSNEFMAKEMVRCEEFELSASTKRELLTLLEDHIILRKEVDLTEHEPLALMLDNNALADVTALYALLERKRLGAKLRPAFEKWVDVTGTSIVFTNESDGMIIHLLSLKRRLDLTWIKAFKRDETLGHGLRESFETFMNKTKKGDATWGTDNTKVGEMIAKYVDQLLRGGAKAIPDVLTSRRSSSITAPVGQIAPLEEDDEDADVDEDAEVNIQLDQVLDLFRFVHGKAVFEAFYKKDLARRLLMGRSASADAERSMLARLKTECGSGFTQNLEQMFKDVELARDEMLSYKQRLEDRIGYEKGKHVDLNVNILSSAAWPSYPDIPVVIPSNIKRSIDDFELHYKSKHSGRKLNWKHALAHCQMRATFKAGSKELVVSSFQAIVLLLFNGLGDNEQLSYAHILVESGLRKYFKHRYM